MRPRHQSQHVSLWFSVLISVALSVILISVAFGVHDEITHSLAIPAVRQSGLVDTSRIDSILAVLTLVVTTAMMVQTGAAAYMFGTLSTRMRRQEIAVRRQSGVFRLTLLKEFALDILQLSVMGGIAGEGLGILGAFALGTFTVVPVRFTPISLFLALPLAVVLALIATLRPAWRAAGTSPALARKD